MRILLGVLLLAVAAAAVPDDREIAAAKEKIQAMLDEAALLEQAGRREEAARVREEAAALKKRIAAAAARGKGDDAPKEPLHEALHRLEQAIGALDRAGYEGMAGDVREAADKLRAQIKQRDGDRERSRGEPGREQDVDFWRRNIGTLVVAMKGLAEAERHDAADMVERAIHARRLMLEGRKDEEAQQIMRKGPDDGQLASLLLKAAGCWREFKQPEEAAQCEELGKFLHGRIEKGVEKAIQQVGEQGRKPGPEDRMARLEERLDRMERMLRDAVEHLEERDRDRDRR